jgi:hypothetical protein
VLTSAAHLYTSAVHSLIDFCVWGKIEGFLDVASVLCGGLCKPSHFGFPFIAIAMLHNILEPTTRVTSFKSDPTELFPSIVLVIANEKRFSPPNFNVKIMRIQRGGGSWMLFCTVEKGLLAHA